jgi:hypothetical protein
VPNWLCGRAATHDDFMDGGATGMIDLGRFLTGFFVVMGIGGSSLSIRISCPRFDWRSVTGHVCSLWVDKCGGNDYEYCGRITHLRNYHQLHHVLSGGARVLKHRVPNLGLPDCIDFYSPCKLGIYKI